MKYAIFAVAWWVLGCSSASADATRTLSGVVLDDHQGIVRGMLVRAAYQFGEETTVTGEEGRFRVQVPFDDNTT